MIKMIIVDSMNCDNPISDTKGWEATIVVREGFNKINLNFFKRYAIDHNFLSA